MRCRVRLELGAPAACEEGVALQEAMLASLREEGGLVPFGGENGQVLNFFSFGWACLLEISPLDGGSFLRGSQSETSPTEGAQSAAWAPKSAFARGDKDAPSPEPTELREG